MVTLADDGIHGETKMITHRDARGRIRRPSGQPHSLPKTRDERSERSAGNPGHFTMRMPRSWRTALDLLARREGKPLTELVLNALENTYPAVLQPVLHGGPILHDRAPSTPRLFGPNRKMQRLEEKIRSPVTNPVPAFDRMGRWQQRQEEKAGFRGNLVDRPRR